jgi:hypothetical protein
MWDKNFTVAAAAVMSPPIRSKEHQEALKKALAGQSNGCHMTVKGLSYGSPTPVMMLLSEQCQTICSQTVAGSFSHCMLQSKDGLRCHGL